MRLKSRVNMSDSLFLHMEYVVWRISQTLKPLFSLYSTVSLPYNEGKVGINIVFTV